MNEELSKMLILLNREISEMLEKINTVQDHLDMYKAMYTNINLKDTNEQTK